MQERDTEERRFSRKDSELQRRLNNIARYRRLEEEGTHTDSLVKQENSGSLRVVVIREFGDIHRRLRRSSKPRPR